MLTCLTLLCGIVVILGSIYRWPFGITFGALGEMLIFSWADRIRGFLEDGGFWKHQEGDTFDVDGDVENEGLQIGDPLDHDQRRVFTVSLWVCLALGIWLLSVAIFDYVEITNLEALG